jgi:hypothetical protein
MLPAVFVPADDVLDAIFADDDVNWVEWLGNERLRAGAAKFLHSIMDGLPRNIHCEVDETAVRAGRGEIRVTFRLPLRKRHLLAALAARKNEKAVRLHLSALGFLPAARG